MCCIIGSSLNFLLQIDGTLVLLIRTQYIYWVRNINIFLLTFVLNLAFTMTALCFLFFLKNLTTFAIRVKDMFCSTVLNLELFCSVKNSHFFLIDKMNQLTTRLKYILLYLISNLCICFLCL